MTIYNELVLPLHDALTQRFPTLGIVVKVPDHTRAVGIVTFLHKDQKHTIKTPDTVDWRANDFRWWLHKFTDAIARKTGL